MLYSCLKAAHLAAVLVFCGGLFVQCFAILISCWGHGDAVAVASRWDRRVTLPAMLAVWAFGTSIAVQGEWLGDGWLWAKLVLVVALTGLHGVQAGTLRRLRSGVRPGPAFASEAVLGAIAVSVAIIALLAATKPF